LVHVTLVGEKQAREGNVFVYTGPLMDCRECKYKLVCFNLVEGKRYKINTIRDAKHECIIHEGGVRAVEVALHPFEAVVDSRHANKDSVVVYKEPKCKVLDCNHYRLCHPVGVKPGAKFKVTKVWEEISCPADNKRVRVVFGD
jgi:uncharacterized protein (UPF0179 family)